MSRLLIFIAGTNGSGKTTLVKTLLSENTTKIRWGKKIIGTYFKDYNIISLGNYDKEKKLGGCDLLKNQQEYFKILDYLLENYPEQHILMEGMMLIVFKSYFNKFKQINLKYNILPIIIILKPSLNLCITRFYNRYQPENYNPKNLIGKYNSSKSIYQKWKTETPFPAFLYDNSKDSIEKSHNILIHIIKKYERI